MRHLIGLLRTRLLVGAAIAAAVLAMAGSAAGSGTYDVCPTGPPACGWTLTDAVTDAIATAGPDTLQPGKTVRIDALNGRSTVEPRTAVTSRLGRATFTVRDDARETVRYRITDVSDHLQLKASPTVAFGLIRPS